MRGIEKCRNVVIGLPAVLAVCVLGVSSVAWGDPCEVVDDGTGTVSLPPEGCEYLSPDEVHLIIDGLPAGTTIELAPIHLDFICRKGGGGPHCGTDDGTGTGGEFETFDSNLDLTLTGTGTLATFGRSISIPILCQTATGPRNPGDPVQSFPTEMIALQGAIFGDPDFAQLDFTAGVAFGLPSPGQTTLTRLGPPGSNFQVDSFFDITYTVDFVGAPGGALAGLAGSTTGIIRMEAGAAGSDCVPALDGTLGCEPISCPVTSETCTPRCANYNPTTGAVSVVDCDCRGPNECQVQVGTVGAAGRSLPIGGPCVIPEGPPGTITMPPAGCDYLTADEVHMLLDGLPPNTTIEMDPIHKGLFCEQGPVGGFPGCPPPGICEDTGGPLGGNVDCFTSSLNFNIQGTGDLAGFNRVLSVGNVLCQVATGPRNPGDVVQDFDTEMVALQGALFGDPDFCTLNITGGSLFGLPSSTGHTTLTSTGGGSFNVDSFFDITYQIEFVGCPGSVLDGLSGTTQATVRMATGAQPRCAGDCPPGTTCVETITTNADGTIDICCDCVGDTCTVLGARSCSDHGTAADPTRICLDILPPASQIEPRLAGADSIEIDVSGGTATSASITCVNSGAYGGLITVTQVGGTVTVDMAPPLPDQDACTITLDTGCSVCVRTLAGDIDRNGIVSTGDASIIKPHFGQSATVAGAEFDFDQNDIVSTGDASIVKPRFGHTAPSCP